MKRLLHRKLFILLLLYTASSVQIKKNRYDHGNVDGTYLFLRNRPDWRNKNGPFNFEIPNMSDEQFKTVLSAGVAVHSPRLLHQPVNICK